jgi:ribosome-binding protein aMBF1 (putative translation factor)
VATKQTTARAKRERRKADAFVEDKTAAALAAANAAPKPEAPKRQGIDNQIAAAGVTAETIAKARDTDGLSWRDVAKAVGLKTPGAARAAYERLTGRPHTASVMTGRRAPRGSRSARGVDRPEWGNDTDPDTITEAVTHRRIYVRREFRDEPEEVAVYEVLYYDTETASGQPCDLTMCFIEGIRKYDTKQQRWFNDGTGSFRAVFVQDVVEVR